MLGIPPILEVDVIFELYGYVCFDCKHVHDSAIFSFHSSQKSVYFVNGFLILVITQLF